MKTRYPPPTLRKKLSLSQEVKQDPQVLVKDPVQNSAVAGALWDIHWSDPNLQHRGGNLNIETMQSASGRSSSSEKEMEPSYRREVSRPNHGRLSTFFVVSWSEAFINSSFCLSCFQFCFFSYFIQTTQKKKNPRKVKKKKKLFSLNDSTKCNKAEANLSTEGRFSPLKWDFPARCKDAIVVARW